MLKVGDAAPDFELTDANRNKVALHDFRGRNVVLAFYVLAFTGGCRNELIAFRDFQEQFERANAQVLGISIDTAASLHAFATSLELNFPLLSDFPHNEATRAYGTYDAEAGVSRRVTYVVDREGIIRAEIVSDEDMSQHAREALRVVFDLEGIKIGGR
jgi:peroxiredoxin (alkyl hydroperoxide reductase subunit C)